MDVPVNINAQLLALIDEHGWAVRHVGAGDTPGEVAFSYTIGLTALGQPEFIMQGMPFDHAQTFLNLLGEEVRGGRRYVANFIVDGSPRGARSDGFHPGYRRVGPDGRH